MADYGELQDHAEAVLALLYAQSGVTTYPVEGGGPTTVPVGATPPYRSVHFASDRPPGRVLSGKSTRMKMRIYVHHVGANDAAARILCDLTAAVLLDVRVDIPGRSRERIKFEQSRQPDPTEPVAQTTTTITDIYVLDTWPGVDGS